MQDNYLVPDLTDEGISMLIRCMDGEAIKFTKIALGDGTPNGATDMTHLANLKLEIGITEFEKREGYLLLTGYCNNTQIEKSFYAKELGVYAQDTEGNEKLYAYKYSETEVDFFPSKNSGRALEVTLSVVAQIGRAENVTAILIEGDMYLSKKEFENHMKASNPHKIKASQIGAAEESHGHSVEDLSGILPPEKGGTGVRNLQELSHRLNIGTPYLGVYTGNGIQGRIISLGFTPSAVILSDNYGNMHDDINGYVGGIAIGKYGCCSQRGGVSSAESWNSGYTTLMIVDNGFRVNYYPENRVYSNANGRSYRFIAFR